MGVKGDVGTEGVAEEGTGKKMIEIDTNRCNACGFCEDVCPTGAITVNGDCARIDANRCTECGSCVDACTRNAIRERIPQRVAATAPAGVSNQRSEVKNMYGRGMVGFGRGLGRGFGYGMGRGFGRGIGFGRGWFGGGRGRGNPSLYCRFAPWLPRRWWAGSDAGYYGAPDPRYGMPYNDPYGDRGW
jgi:NAD-dependent dihydropyrimidine dehydrogenase PreA subunit